MDYLKLYNQKYLNEFKCKINELKDGGFHSRALKEVKDALKVCSDHPEVYYIAAKICIDMKDYELAGKYLVQARSIDSENIDYVVAECMVTYNLNNSINTEEIVSKLMKILKGNPEHYEAHYLLANIYLGNGNLEKAKEEITIIFNIKEVTKESVMLLVNYYITSNEYENSIQVLEKYNKILKDPELFYELARLYYIQDKYEEAKKTCKILKIRYPNSQYVEKAYDIQMKIQNKNSSSKTEKNTNNSKGNDKEYTFKVHKRKHESLEEAMRELQQMIGLSSVKDEINKIISLIQFDEKRKEILGLSEGISQSYNLMFTGNPGTGKTTVARLLGDIFYNLGVLENGYVVEVDRSDIVGQYIGETAQKTSKAIEEAKGGILFIDEAYTLYQEDKGGNDFGKEAIETILKAMEDYRDDMIIIVAGYNNEMAQFLNANPGLESRINIKINFEDYLEEELLEIAKKMSKNNHFSLSESGVSAFTQVINRNKVDEKFANARTVRNIIEKAIRERAYRLTSKNLSKDEVSILDAEDFGIDIKAVFNEDIDTVKKELDSLIGLKSVKETIDSIMKLTMVNKKRSELGIKSKPIEIHMVFQGNPGTGKTTVAEIVAKMLYSIGVLKRNHCEKVTSGDLIGRYVGETQPKTLKAIKKAYGGVLFIDEAYTLAGSANGGSGDFGKEAIATLIKEMEDNRDKLVVILAGYTKEMDEMMNVNPGLKSRIGKYINFEDYSDEEMYDIFIKFCEYEQYYLKEEAKLRLKEVLKEMYYNRDVNFGNARDVRQLFEKVKLKQAIRIVDCLDGDILELKAEDIE